MWYRRSPFGQHGHKVVAFGCTWELVALVPDSPIPSISETVDRFPWFGWMVLGALAHHWYLEAADAVVEAIEDAVEIFEKERSA